MTIGIECHVQLATKTKLFSPADNDARDAEPNSKIHAIDFGLPGMLPRLNHEAVVLAVRAGKALNAGIALESRFDRKHYFYPDLPKGYQTTQMYHPIIESGYIDVPLENGESHRVRIHHAHLEEDAGKLSHYADCSLVDLNRAGTPLIEIVSEPDIHSAEQARAYASELYGLMTYAGVTLGDLYRGNMRFDVNISIAPKGSTTLGTRAEVKNLNSFRSVERAAEYEFCRQAELLERGEAVIQETRGWNDDKQVTTSQRAKSDAQDYRYMPDADIPPVLLTQQEVEDIQSQVPRLPHEYRTLWSSLKVDASVIGVLLSNQNNAKLVTEIMEKGGEKAARRIANMIASSLVPEDDGRLPVVQAAVEDLIDLTKMIDAAEISSTSAKELFNELVHGATNPRDIAKQRNLLQMTDLSAVEAVVDAVLSDPQSQKAIDDIKGGNDKAIGYLVGQVMKQSRGQANPAMAQKMIRERM